MAIIKDYVLFSEVLLFLLSIFLLLTIFFFLQSRKKQNALELLDNVIAMMPGHVYWMDRNSICLGCNDIQAKSAGLNSRHEIVGKRNKDLPWNANTKKLPDELEKVNRKVIETGQTIMLEEPAMTDDDSGPSFLSIKAPLKNNSNEIVGVVGISIDITEKKKIEAELQKTKHLLDGMTLVAASIAHELRTPLANLNITSALIKESLPSLIHGYNLAAQHNLLTEKLSSSEITALEKKPNAIQKETHASLTFIDMLLLNLNPTTDKSKIKIFSIGNCIDETLARFPFTGKQSELVNWKRDEKKDFVVKGDQLIITHILFNLLKNAVYYVLKAGKGDIKIWLEPGDKHNKLFFKDTGTGIPKNEVAHIFDQFFSKTHHGAGIGLTFCQWAMENLGGQISCDSVEGEYTLFTLQFPRVKDEHHD